MKRAFIYLLVLGVLVGGLPKGALAVVVLPSLLGQQEQAALAAMHQESLALSALVAPATVTLDPATRQTLALLQAGNPTLQLQSAGYEQIDVYHHYDQPSGGGPVSPLGWVIIIGLLALLAWSFTLKT